MKIFSKKIKPAVVSLIVLVGLLGVGLGVVAQSNSLIYRTTDFIHSSGLQSKHGRLVVTDSGTDPSDINPGNSIDEPWVTGLRLFIDDKISSFAEVESNGKLQVTPATVGSSSYVTLGGTSGGRNSIATLDTSATVVVDGNILATDFVNYANFASSNRLCTDATGTVSLCASAPVCGNSIVEPGEQCDDGNTYSGDGCSATCQTETPSYGWYIGSWGACNSGTKTRTVQCQNLTTSAVVADSNCTDPKPDTTSPCTVGGQSCTKPSDCGSGLTCVGATVVPPKCTGTYYTSNTNTNSTFGELLGTYAYAAPGDVDWGAGSPPPPYYPTDPTEPKSCSRFTTQSTCGQHVGCSWSNTQVTNPGTCQARSSCLYGTQPNPDFSNTPVDSSGNVKHYGVICSPLGNLAPPSVMQNSAYYNTGSNYRYWCDDGTWRPIGSPGNSTCSLNSPATVHVASDGAWYESWWLNWTKS